MRRRVGACSTSAIPPASSTTRGRTCPPTPTRPSGCSRSSAPSPSATGWAGERREAPAAEERELELVHSRRHVESIRELCLAGGGAIDADTFVGEASYRAALHAAGGACAMTRALLGGEDRVGFCALRPSGHHAEPQRAMGFCLFDNVAIAAELAIRELGAERVLVLDWDVHHGNGTAEAFRRRADVLFISIHQAGIYPGTGPSGDFGSGAGRDTRSTCRSRPAPARSSGSRCSSTSWSRSRAPSSPTWSSSRPASTPTAPTRSPTAASRPPRSRRWPARCATWPRRLGAPLGAVLEGGYDPPALAESVVATMAALGGEGEAVSAAPEALLTSRAAAGVARHWTL